MGYLNTTIERDLSRLQRATCYEIRGAVDAARRDLRSEIYDLRLSLERESRERQLRERREKYERESAEHRAEMERFWDVTAARSRTLVVVILACNILIATLLIAMMRFS